MHMRLRRIVLYLTQDLRIRQMCLMILLVELQQLIGDLPFLKTAVSDGGQNRIPLPKAVFAQHGIHILRLDELLLLESLGFAIVLERFLSADDVLFLLVLFEPLIDLRFGRSALADVQPVKAWTARVLRRHDLDPVAVLNDVIDGHQLPVDSGSHHLVADRGMNRIGKIDGRRPGREILHLAPRRKAVHAVREKIQIALEQLHELLVVRHGLLPLQDLTQPDQLLLLGLIYLPPVTGNLIFPMGRNAVFRLPVHFKGPDLYFKRLAGFPDQGRMQ